jgi:hypothetical protein
LQRITTRVQLMNGLVKGVRAAGDQPLPLKGAVVAGGFRRCSTVTLSSTAFRPARKGVLSYGHGMSE